MSRFWPSFLRYFIPGLLLLVIGTWALIDNGRRHRLEELKVEQRLAISLGVHALNRHVQIITSDLDYLSQSPSLQALTERPDAASQQRLAQDFANFLRSRPIYDQIRWLDASGREVIRVHLVEGQVRMTPASELQDQSDRDYFRQGIAGAPGTFHLSRLDLKRDHGRIVHPPQPVLRIASPIVDRHGQARGLVVLNYLGQEILQHFTSVTERFGPSFQLLDGEGYWLRGERPDDDWGFIDHDTTRSLRHRDPEVWARLQGREGQFEHRGDLWTYEAVRPLESGKGRLAALGVPPEDLRWIILSRIPGSQLAALTTGEAHGLLTLALILFIVLAVGSALLTRQQLHRQAHEARFQAFFDNAMIGMAITAPDQRWLAVNPALCRMLGYDAATLCQRTWSEVTHPDDVESNLAAFEATLRGDQDYYSLQKRYLRADGSLIVADITARILRRADGTPDYFVVIIEDVTAKQKAEHQNRLLNRRAASLLELPRLAESLDERSFMQHAIEQIERLTESRIGFIHFVNDDGNSIELVTWSLSTLANYCHAVFDQHYPIDEAGIWADAARTGQAVIVNDYATAPRRKGLPSGHAHLERFISVPITENGKVRMLLGVGNRQSPYEDYHVETAQLLGSETWRIVQRQRDQRALLAAAEVVSASPIVCFRWQASDGWPVVFVSDNVRQWGYEPGDLVAGHPPFAELVHPDDLKRVVGEVIAHTASGASSYEQEYRLLTHDGRVLWVLDRTRVTRDREGQVQWFDGVLSDISERKQRQTELAAALAEQRTLNKRLEEANNQLMQSEKMASIGQLAAGVAHELNNPIGFVHSNLGTLDAYLNDLMSLIEAYQRLAETVAAGSPELARIDRLKENLDFDFLKSDIFQLVAESKDGLARVKKIVQDLKSFSRVGEQEWQLADLHQGLDSTLNIVWNELKYKCQVVKDYGELPPVHCLISQLNQVFMNLLVNAGHAIEQQGTITLRTRQLDADHVCVEISDTGCGIPHDNLTRIFDPFFTTKPVGKGTGLGLSLSYGIIERHHGRIEVESTVGTGTTFRIVLPIHPNPSPAPAKEDTSA